MANKKRVIKFNYYEVQCVEICTGKLIKFDIYKFVKEILGKQLSELTKDYYQEKARVDKCWYNEEGDYWFFNFTRLRDTNIPNRAYINRKSEGIELKDNEYISEECNAIYDCSLGVLMLQRNIHSVSVSGIAEYLTKIINIKSIRVELTPILSKDVLEKIYHAKEYRKLTIKLAASNDVKQKSRAASSLFSAFNSFNNYNGISAEITISAGRDKSKFLDYKSVRETLDDIQNNRNQINKAVITCKNDDDRVEVIDLIDSVMQDKIHVVLEKRVSLASDYVETLMLERFNCRKGEIFEVLGKREY